MKSDKNNPATFVFRLRRPSGTMAAAGKRQDYWLVLDLVRNLVVLAPMVHKNSSVIFSLAAKNRPVQICPAGAQTKQLTLGSEYIRREDLCYGPVESSEVSIVDSKPPSLFSFE
jgi:hypothetical protein